MEENTAARELEITWSEKGRKEFLERSIARASTLVLSASARAPFEGRSFLGAKWESADRCNCMRDAFSQRLASFRENHARLRKLHLRASRYAPPCTVSSTVAKEREKEREALLSRYRDIIREMLRDPSVELKRNMIIYSAGMRFTHAAFAARLQWVCNGT